MQRSQNVLLRRRMGAVSSAHNPVMLNMMMGSAPQRYFLTKKSNVHDWGFFVVVGERFATMVERFNKFNALLDKRRKIFTDLKEFRKRTESIDGDAISSQATSEMV